MWREAKQEGESIPGLPPCLAGAHSREWSTLEDEMGGGVCNEVAGGQTAEKTDPG